MFCVQYIFLMFYVIEWHYGAKIQLYIILVSNCPGYLFVQFKLQWNLCSGDTHETKASVPRLVVGRVFINDFCGQSLFEC